MVLSFLCFNGCTLLKDLDQDDPFRVIYSADNSSLSFRKLEKKDTRCISLSAHQMSLSSFCRLLSDHFKVGIVFSEKLFDRVVSAEFKETDIDTVFTVLSRQLSVDLVKLGNTFYLGDLKDTDKAILIRRVLSHDDENLNKIIRSLISTTGKGEVLSGRVVIVSDKDFVIRRLSEALDDLERLNLNSWIVQLYFLVLRKDALAEAGLSMSTSGLVIISLKIPLILRILNWKGFYQVFLNQVTQTCSLLRCLSFGMAFKVNGMTVRKCLLQRNRFLTVGQFLPLILLMLPLVLRLLPLFVKVG